MNLYRCVTSLPIINRTKLSVFMKNCEAVHTILHKHFVCNQYYHLRYSGKYVLKPSRFISFSNVKSAQAKNVFLSQYVLKNAN